VLWCGTTASKKKLWWHIPKCDMLLFTKLTAKTSPVTLSCLWQYFTIIGTSYWKGVNIKIFLMTADMKWMIMQLSIQIQILWFSWMPKAEQISCLNVSINPLRTPLSLSLPHLTPPSCNYFPLLLTYFSSLINVNAVFVFNYPPLKISVLTLSC